MKSKKYNFRRNYWEAHQGLSLEACSHASTTIIMLIDEHDNLGDLRGQILEFLPESVYYDRNTYGGRGKILGQQLAFGLDPENLTCPVHGTLEDKMKRHQGLAF